MTMVEPKANFIPSNCLLTKIPTWKSVAVQIASKIVAIPWAVERYKQVTTPTFWSCNGWMTVFKYSEPTRISLSAITKISYLAKWQH